MAPNGAKMIAIATLLPHDNAQDNAYDTAKPVA